MAHNTKNLELHIWDIPEDNKQAFDYLRAIGNNFEKIDENAGTSKQNVDNIQSDLNTAKGNIKVLQDQILDIDTEQDLQSKKIEQISQDLSIAQDNQKEHETKIQKLEEKVAMLENNQLQDVSDKAESITITDSAKAYGKIKVEGNTKQDTEPTITNPVEMKNCNNAINIKIKNKNIFGKGLSTPKENKKFWETIGSDVSALEDGWARFTFNNSSTSTRYVNAFSKFSLFRNIIKANTNYKIITEFRNVQIDDNDNASYFCLSSNYANECFAKNISYYKDKLKTAKQIETLSTKANLDNVVVLFRNFLAISPGHTVSLEVRICVTEDLETENFIEPEEKIISFPLTKGQVLRKGDYLASDGIHRKIRQFAINGTEKIFNVELTEKGKVLFNFHCIGAIGTYGGATPIRFCNRFNKSQLKKWGSVTITGTDGIATFTDQVKILCDNVFGIVTEDDLETRKTKVSNWIKQNNIILDIELEQETIEEYTEEQQNVYNELQNVLFFKGNNYISSEDEISPIMQAIYVVDINNKIDKIEESRGHIYGVRRKITDNTNTEWERIKDSVGLVANATKNGESVKNDFDSLLPWSEIKSCNYDITTEKVKAWFGDATFNFNGSNGDVYTYIPDIYLKIYQEDDYDYVLISDVERSGFVKYDSFYISRYTMSIISNKLRSYTGLAPTVGKTISQFRTLAKQLGDKFSLLDYRYFVLQMLYLVEYANYNSQEMLGNGLIMQQQATALITETGTNRIVVSSTNLYVGRTVSVGTAWANTSIATNRKITKIEDYNDGSITGKAVYFDGNAVNITVGNVIWGCGQHSGQCNNLGMKSGCIVSDGYHSMIYRGIENIFSNVWQFIDGITTVDRVSYICKEHLAYEDSKITEPYKKIGYTNANADGYIKKIGFDSNEPLVRFPVEVGGNSSIGTSDYYNQNIQTRLALVGGGFYDGAYSGFWCCSFNGGFSNSGVGIGCRALIDNQ